MASAQIRNYFDWKSIAWKMFFFLESYSQFHNYDFYLQSKKKVSFSIFKDVAKLFETFIAKINGLEFSGLQMIFMATVFHLKAFLWQQRWGECDMNVNNGLNFPVGFLIENSVSWQKWI